MNKAADSALSEAFHPIVQRWFEDSFDAATQAQQLAWPPIARGENTLLLAPTGSGKTLAAFMVAINRLMFETSADATAGVRVLYLSPLKALGVDVERNLQSPLAGGAAVAGLQQAPHRKPSVAIRTGDTPSRDRAHMAKHPPDILITTPESLFLMLTSKVRDILASVDTIIIDEIHTMVSTKRGAHLFVSLERLELLRQSIGAATAPAQRIGLSATQRPLDEVARLLGGADIATGNRLTPRAVTIVDAGMKKSFDIQIELPIEDPTAQEGEQIEFDGAAAGPEPAKSSWTSIHPRLVELIRDHRSTMIFVNSRRLAERLAGAINELADDEIAAAHHGSIARETRAAIEDRLKSGSLPAIVATSSLELGIDMGAVDLVIQIEAPPSIASGVQRVGRGGHQVGVVSRGIIMPKYRGDLLASAAASAAIVAGEVESSRYPRNPLDVLAQQIVAMVALEAQHIDALFATVRQAAPFHELTRSMFESVLELLAGRYPSDEFSDLRPRVVWDRLSGQVSGRRGAQRIAIANAGTIPDRGLYGVFLADGSEGSSKRVGELDEEMVFETRPGEIFLLGASSWLVIEITHDRVLVVPAPGEPGRMPFWRGDGPGRPLEFGRAIGRLARKLGELRPAAAGKLLQTEHGLHADSATSLIQYLQDQRDSGSEVPTDRRIVVESFVDEVGDWRVIVLSPFGSPVHAPWAIAITAQVRQRSGIEVEAVWTDDGIVLRMPESDEPTSMDELFPDPEQLTELVTRELANTALFAARFRENAGRALLLPRRMPGKRTPLWLQRRRASDLLSVAARFDNFPIILETYREVLSDVFDLSGLRETLSDVKSRRIEVHQFEGTQASPLAAAIMFNYAGNFIYDGDAPLAERRAQALAFDFSQLRELLGEAELRELLEGEVVDQTALELQRLDAKRPVRDGDELHDLLMALGDLDFDEMTDRVGPDGTESLSGWLRDLNDRRRIVEVSVAGQSRYIASEDAGRYRDGLGCVIAPGLPDSFLQNTQAPLQSLIGRYASTHVPFTTADVSSRFGVGTSIAEGALKQLLHEGKMLEGEFLPGGRGREWCDARVLRLLKQRSLARIRKTIEPVSAAAFAGFVPRWQGLVSQRRGLDALLDVVHQLQGVAIPVSVLEHEVLPARIDDYLVGDIDRLCAAGEVVWCGIDSIGATDGRIALYLADDANRLAPNRLADATEGSTEARIVQAMAARGALFFDDIVEIVGGFPADVLKSLWNLVWAGEITNDTLAPLRSLARSERRGRRERATGRPRGFRSRRSPGQAGSEGRWSLLRGPQNQPVTATESRLATVEALLERYGVLTREAVAHEGIVGGFSAIYPLLKQMEQSGRVRRGYFVDGLGASQFALAGADERLRDRADSHEEQALMLSACDPANAWGALLKWPRLLADASGRPSRSAGARVVLVAGQLVAWLGRSNDSLILFNVENDAADSQIKWPGLLADALSTHAQKHNGLIIKRINGREWNEAAPDLSEQQKQQQLQAALEQADFAASAMGMQYRPPGRPASRPSMRR